ncbi:hypothetical protein M422DRAFT_184605 [Sphaerobolus stellatus SS14]|uniref:Nucleoside transporter n=1 Tax=Sphaerobolus stellatus (strain SS14) TaxID=990650 RepID=A0A0C9USZ6_SPHS4|nr:hypothetical protein M422DRAFT_184605 [Sphaerobolus stellatus SS14]
MNEDWRSPEDNGVEEVLSSVGVDRRIPESIRWIFFVLGAAILLPWCAIITAMPYFRSRLEGSVLQSSFGSYLTVTFTVANFCFLAHATVNTKNSNSARTTRRTLWIITVLNALFTLTTFTVLSPTLFFFFVILNGILQATAGSYLQSAVMAVASLFGPTTIQSIMSGQAAIGVLVSLIQVLSAVASVKTGGQVVQAEDDEAATRAAFLFFGVSTLFMVLAVILHSWLLTIPAYKVVVIPYESMKGVIGQAEEREGLVGHSRNVSQSASIKGSKKNHILEVAKLNIEYNFAVAYTFIITLAVFPAITSSITSVHVPPTSLFTRPLLFIALHFLIFNVGDLIGRYLPLIPRLQVWSSRPLLYLSLARTLFIPAFLACNVGGSSNSPADSIVIKSDMMFFLILLIFSVTNGYLGSIIMMTAPSPQHNKRLEHRPEDVDIAATIAQFCLVGGLVIGSFVSFGVSALICSCNPFVQ